jgi:hypothetical protein
MLSQDFAKQFAVEWVAAWNSHDLERILSHYTDDFEMSSPYIVQMMGLPGGKLQGKAAAGAYWRKALDRAPNLHFELIEALVGLDSVVIYYRGARGMAAEVFFFNEAELVTRAHAHCV